MKQFSNFAFFLCSRIKLKNLFLNRIQTLCHNQNFLINLQRLTNIQVHYVQLGFLPLWNWCYCRTDLLYLYWFSGEITDIFGGFFGNLYRTISWNSVGIFWYYGLQLWCWWVEPPWWKYCWLGRRCYLWLHLFLRVLWAIMSFSMDLV